MSKINCTSCEDLREYAPDFVENGVTKAVCTSLKNNTGLGTNASHNDCDDLDDANDCLIGAVSEEIDSYDTCEWKPFMKRLLPNLHTMLKSFICSMCGLWEKLESLSDKTDSICALQEATLQHPVTEYGTLPNGASSHRGGTIATKNGNAVLVPLPKSEVSEGAWEIQNVGINYGKLEVVSCKTGKCVRHEWISPSIQSYKVNENVTLDYWDVLWSCSKSVAQNNFGMTDDMWEIRAKNPITWASDFAAGRQALIGIRLSVENNNLVMRYVGAIGGNDAAVTGQNIIPPADQSERLYRFSC